MPQTELLDDFSGKEPIGLFQGVDRSTDGRIGFQDATFAWSCDTDGSLTPSKRSFTLHIEGELFFTRGHINVIAGPTGSGKTSLLMALLGVFLDLLAPGLFLISLKARCIFCHRDLNHGIIYPGVQVLLTQHRNRGF